MSNTKNTNEKNAEAKITDTAPYMKKDRKTDGQPASSKNNIVVPLVLLLISAIVIVATFYQDKNSNLATDNNSPANATKNTVSAAAISTKAVTTKEQSSTASTIQTDDLKHIATAAKDTSSSTKVSTQSKTQNKTASVIKENKTLQQANNMAKKQANPARNQTYIKTAYVPPYQHNDQARRQAYEQSMAHDQEHNEMILQRRQAYEKEMQSRQQQHEAAMKAREEKMAKIFAAQDKAKKTIFKRVQQNRIETNKKLQEMRNRIAGLHDEIHQLMRESRIAYKKPSAAPAQVQNPTAGEM